MIQLETPFPNPGSYAEHDGKRGRILSHMAGDVVLISLIDGPTRRVPLAELDNPADEDIRELAMRKRMGDADTRRALWIARHLRDQNETTLQDLDRAMHAAANKGEVPVCYDRGHLSRILRMLDWACIRRRNIAGLMVTDYVRTALSAAA